MIGYILSTTLLLLVAIKTSELYTKFKCRSSFYRNSFKNISKGIHKEYPSTKTFRFCNFIGIYKRDKHIHKTSTINNGWKLDLNLKTTIKNNGGIISFPAMLITIMISYAAILAIIVSITSYLSNQRRAKAYLCYRYYTQYTNKYINHMGKFNIAIASSFALQAVPQFYAKAKIVNKILKRTQSIAHISYLKKITSFLNCSWKQRSIFFKTIAYKTNGTKLSRDSTGIVPLKNKEWKVFIPSYKEKFIIWIQYKMESSYGLSAVVDSKEINLDLVN